MFVSLFLFCDFIVMLSLYLYVYIYNYKVLDDGFVVFECLNNIFIWFWLNLLFLYLIVVQMINFWVLVELGIVLGIFDLEKWSVFIYVDWMCDDLDVGYVVCGIYWIDRDGDEM